MAGQWKAKTTDVSEVETSGVITVRFDVKMGANIIFPNQVITTTPDTYKDDVKRKSTELMNLYLAKQSIPKTEVIDLD